MKCSFSPFERNDKTVTQQHGTRTGTLCTAIVGYQPDHPLTTLVKKALEKITATPQKIRNQ